LTTIGRIGIDDRLKLLRSMKTQTPRELDMHRNGKTITEIKTKAVSRVAMIKDRFRSLHEEMVKQGKIKREDSWKRFIMPEKMCPNNHMQRALNFT